MTLVERLRAKASMIELGEKIAWGSDTALMHEAADRIDAYKVEYGTLRAINANLMGDDQCQALDAENTALRQIIHESAAALPNGAFVAPECSVEFMSGLPNEIRLVFSTLKAELVKARDAALEEAARLIDEGYARPGIQKKQDTCPHQKFGWDDCDICASAAIRALKGKKANL